MARWFALQKSGLAVAAALVFGFAAACSSSKPEAAATGQSQAATSSAVLSQAAAPALTEAKAAPATAVGKASVPGGGSPPTSEVVPGLDRKIVRTASLGLVVDDPDAAVGGITSVATGLGGYVAQSSLSRSDNKLRGTITIRVPVEGFDQAMAQIKRLGLRVERENVAGQDVAQEYSDSQARVRNLEATEEQLRLLLGTVREKSSRAEDILAVYRELTAIQGQIEQAKGRIQYLDKVTTLATLTIDVVPIDAVSKQASSTARARWSPMTTLRSAAGTLGHATQVMLDVAIWLVVVALPVTLALAAPVALAYVAVRRRLRIVGGSRPVA